MFQRVRLQQYWSILIAQIALLFLGAVMTNHIILSILFIIGLFGVYGSLIVTIWQATLPRFLALASGIIAIGSGFLWAIPGVSARASDTGLSIACMAYAIFILIAAISIIRYVFITDRVTTNRIVGSICIYLLIGMFFAFVYAAMDIVVKNAFYINPAAQAGREVGLSVFTYFSYSTLTTIGYGDVLATHPVSRVLACLEGIIGPVYLAIMVARLVGMHITQANEKKH